MATTINIADILGDKQEYYLGHTCKTIDKSLLYAPSAQSFDEVWIPSDRNIPTLNRDRKSVV